MYSDFFFNFIRTNSSHETDTLLSCRFLLSISSSICWRMVRWSRAWKGVEWKIRGLIQMFYLFFSFFLVPRPYIGNGSFCIDDKLVNFYSECAPVRLWMMLSSQKLGQILCVSGQDGKGRLGRPVRVTAKMTGFCFSILLVFFLKHCIALSLYPSSVFRLEHTLLLMNMFYLVAIFLITLSCIWLQLASGIMVLFYHITSFHHLFSFSVSKEYSALEVPHQIVIFAL